MQGDHAAARRTLLAAVAKGRLPDGQHGLVEIGRIIDDDRVLAAHLAHDLLDEGLAGLRIAGDFQDPQADLLRTREGDQGHAGIADEHIAHFAARGGKILQDLAGHAGLPEDFAKQPGNAAGLRRRLDDGRVARDQRGRGHAGTDRQGEVPGTDDRGHAAGLVPLVVQFAHETAQALGLEEADGQAGVILAEVDGLADVGIGFAPGLARLANHHGGQPIAAAAHRGGGLDEDLRAFQGRAIAPCGKGLGGGGDGLPAGIRADGRDLGHVQPRPPLQQTAAADLPGKSRAKAR